MPMIAITTRSSTSVNPRRPDRENMTFLPKQNKGKNKKREQNENESIAARRKMKHHAPVR
jgi:hypothetical protein